MVKGLKLIAVLAASTLLLACGKVKVDKLESSDKIVIIGDDITVGVGGKGTTFPEELGVMVGNWVVNAGVEGDTSTKAKNRVDTVITKEMPSHLMIMVGMIDMQQKVADSQIEENINQMIEVAKENNVIPIVVGMPRPATPGSNLKLTDAPFYSSIANKHDVVYLKNGLSDVLDQATYRSSPTLLTSEGYKELANKIAHQMKEAGFISSVKE